jgi:hypothetical protein
MLRAWLLIETLFMTKPHRPQMRRRLSCALVFPHRHERRFDGA